MLRSLHSELLKLLCFLFCILFGQLRVRMHLSLIVKVFGTLILIIIDFYDFSIFSY